MSEDLAIRRRRARFRAWHRGTQEMDLILGHFADAHLDGFDSERLTQFEQLLEHADRDVESWVMGRAPVPQEARTPMTDLLLAFRPFRRP